MQEEQTKEFIVDTPRGAEHGWQEATIVLSKFGGIFLQLRPGGFLQGLVAGI